MLTRQSMLAGEWVELEARGSAITCSSGYGSVEPASGASQPAFTEEAECCFVCGDSRGTHLHPQKVNNLYWLDRLVCTFPALKRLGNKDQMPQN